MSLFIKFYFTSSMLNMFRTIIHPSSGAYDFSIVSPHWSCVLVSMCVGVSVWLVGVVSVWQAEHVSDINTSIIRSSRHFYCITTLVVCSFFDVCCSFGVAGLGWYPCGRLKHNSAFHTDTMTAIRTGQVTVWGTLQRKNTKTNSIYQ